MFDSIMYFSCKWDPFHFLDSSLDYSFWVSYWFLSYSLHRLWLTLANTSAFCSCFRPLLSTNHFTVYGLWSLSCSVNMLFPTRCSLFRFLFVFLSFFLAFSFSSFISSFLSRSVIVFILCERTVFFLCCHRNLKTCCRYQRWVTNFRLSLLIFTRRNMKTLSNSIDVEQISPWMTKSKLSKLCDYKEKAIKCQYVFETVSVNENM